jgi:hypothetical protein
MATTTSSFGGTLGEEEDTSVLRVNSQEACSRTCCCGGSGADDGSRCSWIGGHVFAITLSLILLVIGLATSLQYSIGAQFCVGFWCTTNTNVAAISLGGIFSVGGLSIGIINVSGVGIGIMNLSIWGAGIFSFGIWSYAIFGGGWHVVAKHVMFSLGSGYELKDAVRERKKA